MESACRANFPLSIACNTKCSDVGDDDCFSSDIVSWSECVGRDAPLLVPPIDSDDSFAAKLHSYSGVLEQIIGIEGQCCIPSCTRTFPVEQTKGWMFSVLKERASNQNDVEEVGPVCKFHYARIIRADKRNRNIKKLTPKVCVLRRAG